RRPSVPGVLEQREPRDRLGGHRLDRPGGDEVEPDLLRPELARQVAVHALQRRLGDTHPVVGGPRLAVVEVETDERPALAHQGYEGIGELLQRVRRHVHRDGYVVPRRGAEGVAEGPRGSEPGPWQAAAETAPRRRPRIP